MFIVAGGGERGKERAEVAAVPQGGGGCVARGLFPAAADSQLKDGREEGGMGGLIHRPCRPGPPARAPSAPPGPSMLLSPSGALVGGYTLSTATDTTFRTWPSAGSAPRPLAAHRLAHAVERRRQRALR